LADFFMAASKLDLILFRHSSASWNPAFSFTAARFANSIASKSWIPACAGTTSQEYSMNSTSSCKTAAPAPLGWRLITAVYDLFPLMALWFFATILAVLLTGGALDVHRLGHKLLEQALLLAVSAIYFVVSWIRGGQTIGMKPWRLRIVAADGGAVDLRRALIRFAVALVSLAALGLGFLWCLIDREKRAWHDIAAGTLLVRLEKNP
jgi:uncharacterized RDD family membrane protein YckC